MPGSSTTAWIVNGGTATLTSNGAVCGNLYLGALSGGTSGTIEMLAGSLQSSANEAVGWYGTGTFDQSGGTHVISGSLYVSYTSGGNIGTYNLSEAAQLSAGDECIGFRGTGVFTQSGGTYYLIESGSAPSGTLGTITSGTIDGYPASLAVQNDNLVLTVVPEPGTLALLGVGAVGLGTANSFNPKPTTTAGEKPFQERACGIGILPVRGLETNSWRRSRLAKRRDQSHTRNPRKDNQHENVESSIPPRTCSAHWFLLCQRPGGR